MRKINSLKVSVSGVRGIVGESLTPSLITSFAAAFGEYVGGGRVVVGRDTRVTGPMCERAVVAGLLSVGCQPRLLGVVPTPTVQIAINELNANGAIAITASHNPGKWNAMKFIGSSGIFLNHTEAAELLDIYNQPDRAFVMEPDIRQIKEYRNSFNIQKKRIFKLIDKDVIKNAKLRVAVDCCNGAGAFYTRDFLEELGCEVISIFDETDGIFRRKPEPLPENITELSRIVKENDCHIGFAQDPDADRVVIVDSTGRAIGENFSVVLAAEHVLSKTPGNVVVNIGTTRAIEDVADKYGCRVFRTKVGEINVTSKLLEENAVIGGEGGSGGVIWPAMHPCRDSFSGMALVLEMMALRKKSLEDILSDIPQYQTAKAKVPCSAEKAFQVVRSLKEEYPDANTIDGLKLDWVDAWILIRASNTEPIIRLTCEARTQERADQLVAEFSDKINSFG